MAVKRNESAPAIILNVAIDEGKSCINTAKVELIKIAKPIGIPITKKNAIRPNKIDITTTALINSLLSF